MKKKTPFIPLPSLIKFSEPFVRCQYCNKAVFGREKDDGYHQACFKQQRENTERIAEKMLTLEYLRQYIAIDIEKIVANVTQLCMCLHSIRDSTLGLPITLRRLAVKMQTTEAYLWQYLQHLQKGPWEPSLFKLKITDRRWKTKIIINNHALISKFLKKADNLLREARTLAPTPSIMSKEQITSSNSQKEQSLLVYPEVLFQIILESPLCLGIVESH